MWHEGIPEEYKNRVVVGDHYELAKRLPDNSIKLIFTDPPYPKEFLHCFEELGQYAGRVLDERCSLITLCGQWEVPYVVDYLRAGGLKYHWTGWMINDQKPTLFGFRVVNGGKPLLWFAKGQPKIDYGFWWDTKHFRGARDKQHHQWGQPIEYAIQDILLFTKPGDVVLEPFIGGGTTAAACKILGRNWIGFELDPVAAKIAQERIDNVNPPLFVPELEQMQFVYKDLGVEVEEEV